MTEGKGSFRLGSGAAEAPYGFATRFGNAPGTNPEELIAAVHASCFAMSMASGIGKAGQTPKRIDAEARVQFEQTEAGWRIQRITLVCDVDVPGMNEAELRRVGEDAKKNCPISVALQAVPIELELRTGGHAVAQA